MASSSIIASIDSALDDVDFLVLHFSELAWENDIFKKLRYWLRNLKTFVLCGRKLGNDVHLRSNDNKSEDGSLGSLLIGIEEAVGRNARKIHSYCLELKDAGTALVGSVETGFCEKKIVSGFETDIQSLKEEINERYITMLDYTRQSSSVTAHEVVEITESILENLLDFPFPSFSEITVEPMEALQEYMKFLKNFCSFVTKSGVEHGQMEDLLIHTEAVAIKAAHLCFLCGDDSDDEEWRKRMQSEISILLEKIKPIDRQVYETYYQALSDSKLCRRLHAPAQDINDDSTNVMKNLIDSLISVLWDILRLDTCHVVSLRDHRKVLYEELRMLRTILKKFPNNIDDKTWGDIGVVVCDAGVLVCSFYQKNADPGLGDLLERIKLLQVEVREKVPRTSKFKAPENYNELDYLRFLLENLMKITNDKVEPVVNSIKEEVLFLKSFLQETVELRYEQEKLQALRNRVLEALDQVNSLINFLVVGDISNLFSMQYDSFMEDIRNIKTDPLMSSYGKGQEIKVQEVTRTLSSQKTVSVTPEFVGFHDEAISIRNRLRGGSPKLQFIAIVGMGGLGKTTLATKVYNDPSFEYHFQVRARCLVSQRLDKKSLLLELLNQICPGKYSETEELAKFLKRELSGKRYLIFLDDIWTIEAWNSLKLSFPDHSTRSRIILTSRNRDIACMLDQEPHFLRPLQTDESLELLQMKLFPGKNWPPALNGLQMQIANNCKGLPLTIVIVAGLLAATDQNSWKEFVDGLSSGIVFIAEQCNKTLELSYKHLPDYLKACLLYFVTFPKNQELSVRRLIRLWIAEELVQKDKNKSLKDVAERYMTDLTGRSLIMVAQQRSTGGVKSCRIHDLLHDFCLKKARQQYFFHLLKGNNDYLPFKEPCNLESVCIHSKPEHFKESKLFGPCARSLRFFSPKTGRYEKEVSIDISMVIHIFKLVGVLDLLEIYLGDVFPNEIEFLVQLRYLSIRGNIRVIPSSIGNLSMLDTFIVDPCGEKVSLPDTIWNLQKLEYLCIWSIADHGGGSFPIENLDNSSVLRKLDRFSGAVFLCRDSMKKQMSKFPNIRKLKCMLFNHWDATEEFQNIVLGDFPSELKSLNMLQYMEPPENIKFEFCLPESLTRLTLSRFRLPWSKMSTIRKLPNLEVLKLLEDSFSGETWEMQEEEEFSNLTYLKLRDLHIVRWKASNDQFPYLEKLVLEECEFLQEMPSCLETSSTLETIEVSKCSSATRNLLQRIKEAQEKLDSALKIHIRSS